eukprot:scaffold27400_cov140-Isochrysis_galbana.AAC.4
MGWVGVAVGVLGEGCVWQTRVNLQEWHSRGGRDRAYRCATPREWMKRTPATSPRDRDCASGSSNEPTASSVEKSSPAEQYSSTK